MKKALLVYGITYIALLLLVFGLLFAVPKLELHLLLNSWHTAIQDTFFKFYSTLAEWPLYVVALLPLFWKKYRITIFFALSELTAGGILQILKHTISSDRPISAFESCGEVSFPIVEGVCLHHSNSFPSGHASTFFVFFTCCALLLEHQFKLKNKQDNHSAWFVVIMSMVMLMFLVLAALGAYSRIYLSQHFLSDVCVGSIIGVITPCLFFYFGRDKILGTQNKDAALNEVTVTHDDEQQPNESNSSNT
jgi:membrane-associated phospholipid phosphatase